MTLEPAVLGLMVAPSSSGVLLAVAALVAFLARTPAEVLLVDRFRSRELTRTSLAWKLTLGYSAAIAALVIGAWLLAEGPFWLVLVMATPLLLVELSFARKSRSRRLLPELAGSIAIGGVAPAIALAAGASWMLAWGLWIVVTARVVAAIPFVRVQLRRAKSQEFRQPASDLAQLVAVGAVAAGLARMGVPVAALLAIAFLAVVHAVEVRRPPRRAAIIGAQQVVLGLTVLVATGLGYLAP